MNPVASVSDTTHTGRDDVVADLVADGPSDPAPNAALLRPITRRPSPQQGRALEILAHAIEYLMDSRIARINEPVTRADGEALDILMQLNRAVFSECAEVIPAGRRLKAWLAKRIFRRAQ